MHEPRCACGEEAFARFPNPETAFYCVDCLVLAVRVAGAQKQLLDVTVHKRYELAPVGDGSGDQEPLTQEEIERAAAAFAKTPGFNDQGNDDDGDDDQGDDQADDADDDQGDDQADDADDDQGDDAMRVEGKPAKPRKRRRG